MLRQSGVTLSRRTLKMYAIVLALLWFYTASAIVMTSVCWPGTLDGSQELPIRGAVGAHWDAR